MCKSPRFSGIGLLLLLGLFGCENTGMAKHDDAGGVGAGGLQGGD